MIEVYRDNSKYKLLSLWNVTRGEFRDELWQQIQDLDRREVESKLNDLRCELKKMI